ncbi:hypothetical protein V1264_010666 [Littorina saxatilis]|uniref:G-protein coupled receptors family 1 profile domain-containing protein n=1 Tax=Littorina saxatilis TaxID=31220 RepID=A0AAN9G0R5_9CAEN
MLLSLQCVHREKVCDGQVDCHNQVDEDLCSTSMGRSYVSPSPPAVVELLRSGEFIITKMNNSQPGPLGSAPCPETHFQCPGDGYCMPGYLRCNGVSDCLGEEDEADCNTYTCPGHYRCRGSISCLHPHYLCDGIYHCPQHDDELLCDLDCPEGCTCYGQAFFCRRPFPARSFPRIRYLDGRASGIRILDLEENTLLIHLNLAENWLTSAEGPTFPNLRRLDLSDNKIKGFYVYDLGRLPQLETLVLSGNPLVHLFESGKRHAVVNVIFPWTSTPHTILTTAYQSGSFTSEDIDTTEYLNDLNDTSTDENSTSERRHTMSLSTEYPNDKFKITGTETRAYTSGGVDTTAYTSAGVDTTAYTSAGVDITAYTSAGVDNAAYTSAGVDNTAYTSAGVDTTTHTSAGVDTTAHTSAGVDITAYTSAGVDTAAYTSTGVDTTAHTSAGVDTTAHTLAGVDTTTYTTAGVDTTTNTTASVDTATYLNGSRTNENSTSDPVSTPGLQTRLYSTEWASVSAPANSSEVNETSSDKTDELGIMPSLKTLDLSRVKIEVLDVSFFSLLPDLQILNLSGSEVDSIIGDGFKALTLLHTLDIRGCPLTHFPPDMFSGLQNLQTVYSDNFKLCCPALLPIGFNLQNCFAPTDEISSCESLLRSNVYRIFLSIFAAMALLGNSASFIYRVFLQKKKRLLSFDVFVAHLCVGDFLMGVYLMVIGVADRLYQGTYLWEDNTWKSSAACKMAGFLSLMSSEVSAMVIVLITVDRFLVLRFPFSRLHFDSRSAQIACFGVWAVGFIVAAAPLVPVLEHWKFYGQSGICIPLPVTRSDFPGHTYAFGVMIIANFALFIIIAAGQIVIYWSIHSNSMSSSETTRKSHDITIARRLITVAMSDFLCWFPIGLLGLLAATGTPIPGEVNVAMAIFVLPFNSALNPFLYTLNLVLEKRRKAEEERIKKRLMSQFKSMVSDDKTMSTQFNH